MKGIEPMYITLQVTALPLSYTDFKPNRNRTYIKRISSDHSNR